TRYDERRFDAGRDRSVAGHGPRWSCYRERLRSVRSGRMGFVVGVRRKVGLVVAAFAVAVPVMSGAPAPGFPVEAAADASAVVPVVPGRVHDTRQSSRVAAGGMIEVSVTGRLGVPTGAAAVFLNVTA